MIHTDIMVKNMKDYDRELFSRVVECVRWCLDEGVLSVSQLQKMKARCIAYDTLINDLKETTRDVKELALKKGGESNSFESAFTKDT